jgi:putative methyltransferase (TIGR04325 family)
MPLTRLIKPLVPPLLWSIGRDVKRRLVRSVDHYAYAPLGWNTPLPAGNGNDAYWSTFVGREQAGCQELIARVRGGAPLLTTDDEMLNYVMLGYVLALASRHRDALRVIDYGGNLGEYYWVGKALVPGIAFEFHCRELPPVAAAGRALSPEVIWHVDDACLSSSYDVVVFSGSLPYLPDWRDVIQQAARATRHYLFASTPAVKDAPSFVITQRTGGVTTLQQLLNRSELIDAVQRAGLRLLREFPMGPHPRVTGAPEQPTSMGFLFAR